VWAQNKQNSDIDMANIRTDKLTLRDDIRLIFKMSTDLSNEGDKVMFTHGEHFDVSNNDHLVMVFVEYGVVQHI